MNFLDNLYEVYTKSDPNKKVVNFCNSSHPIFKAHFPTQPLLPAFLQIELFEKLFNLNIKTIKKAKFISMITPNMQVTIEKNDKKISIFDANNKKISELIYE